MNHLVRYTTIIQLEERLNTLLEFEIYHPKDLNEFCDHMELLGYPEFSDYKNSSCDDCLRHLLKIKEDLYSSISNS